MAEKKNSRVRGCRPNLEMLSGKKTSRRHQTREYRRLLRPQKDLSAFFGPLAVVIGLLSLVALAVGGAYTTGRNGVMPQYETSAVWQPVFGHPPRFGAPLPCPSSLAPYALFSLPISAVLPSHLDTFHAPQHNRATTTCCSTRRRPTGSLQVLWAGFRSSIFIGAERRCNRARMDRC